MTDSFDYRKSKTVASSDRKNYPLSFDAWGKQKNTLDYSVLHTMATFDISPKVWFVDEDGVELVNSSTSTRATSKSGGFNVDSGNVVGNSCILRGKRHPRYQPNRGWLFSTAGVLPNKNVVARRAFGGITEESGLFFELVGGVLNTVVRSASWQYFTATAGQTVFTYTDTAIALGSSIYVRTKVVGSTEWHSITAFSVVDNVVTLSVGLNVGDRLILLVVKDTKHNITSTIESLGIDIEKETLYDIQSQWRGAGNTGFFVNSKLVYTHENLGIGVYPTISNPALPISFISENLGDAASMLMGCADITSEGGNTNHLEYTALVNKPQVQIPATAVTLPPKVLMVAYSPTLFKGRHNTRDFHVLGVTASTDSNAFIGVYTSRNPVWTAGSLLLKSREDGSAILYDNALDATNTTVRGLTFDTNSGNLITSLRIPADASSKIENPNIYKVEYTITHGDYLIIVGFHEKAGTANMLANVELGEEI